MEGSFSRLLYDMKAAQEPISGSELSVTSYIIRHHGLKCDSFEPNFNVKEMAEMNREDTALLLNSLVSSNHYDVIVVDTDVSLDWLIIGKGSPTPRIKETSGEYEVDPAKKPPTSVRCAFSRSSPRPAC